MATSTCEKSDLMANELEYPPPGNQHTINACCSRFDPRRPFPQKSILTAYLLWFPFGFLGLHRFYLHYNFMGFLYLFTLGYFGIGWLVDGFFIPSMVKERNKWLKHVADHPEEVKTAYACMEDGCKLGPGIIHYRSLRDAYILTLHPVGILGVQHHYLGRPWYRLAYSITGGLLGLGWITDMFRMPSLVKQTNTEIKHLIDGKTYGELRRHEVTDCNTFQAYLFALPGFFGFHHFYLGRKAIGFAYFFTGGLCGIGWLVDLIRLPWLVKRSNKERKEMPFKHLDDAYLFYFPLGILGFHHFYLNRPCWGIIYFFTAGLFGIGWLVDLFRMPRLVKDANLRIKQSVRIITSTQHTYVIPADTNVFVFGPNNQNGYPSNGVYPSAPAQHYQQQPVPPPPQQYPEQYPALPHVPPPQYSENPPQNPGPVGGYQTSEYPPVYTAVASNEAQPRDEQLKQYSPP